MKKLFIVFFIMNLSQQAFCQEPGLDHFNQQKNKIDKTGFLVLGSWAAVNIIYGTIATSGAHGSNKYFNQMNAIWNSVNLGLATISYFGIKKEIGLNYATSLREQIKMEKIFLFNGGVDLAYIATGLYLKERSKNVIKDSDKFKGYGESIILQGGSLLIFDAIMYTIHNRHGKQLYKLAEKVKLTVAPGSIGILVKL